MDIGAIITKYCDEHGMSSTEFANRVGVSRAYIYMLKRGKRYKAEKDLAKNPVFMRNFTHT